MPGDRLLGTLLRSFQIPADQQDTPRLLGSASSLLTTLNNPLNVTLLTSHLLSGRAIWSQPDGLQTCTRCLSVFHSAARALVKHNTAMQSKSTDTEFEQLQLERTLPQDDWIRAVANGADEHSPRWRHLLVLGGLLLGFGPIEDENLSTSMRRTLERAFVTAVNLALEEIAPDDDLGQQSLTFVLNHCFSMIPDAERDQLHYDQLLPVLTKATLHCSEGLQSAYFLGTIDLDVKPNSNSKPQFRWAEASQTFRGVQKMLSSPLIASLGPLSRLIGHCVERVQQPQLVTSLLDDLEAFARTLQLQWRQNKLSEIDPSEEDMYLDQESRDRTTPELWKLLRSTLYAIVITLRSAVGRVLGDSYLAKDAVAPIVAAQVLRTLHSLYFVTTRMNAASFSQYTFVNLTAIDILSAYPSNAQAFIQYLRPAIPKSIPEHPLDRCSDLFFLNTAEHFTLTLPANINEELLIASATPYLASGGNTNLLHIFEAAHSLVLAVISAPQNAQVASKHLPNYVDTLFKVFPSNLTARQFRMAFKTLLKLTSPPNILSNTHPMMAAVLLDLLRERAQSSGTTPLFPTSYDAQPLEEAPKELSEQAVITTTVIDSLPEVSLPLLDEWLPLAGEMVNAIEDVNMRELVRDHFWHTLIDGGMDPDRSQLCHSWWSTGGGHEMLLFGRVNVSSARDLSLMSGALPTEPPESKM